MPHVEVDALAGSDTINIAPSTTTTFTVDGGDPIGVLPGDTINFIHPAAAYQLFPGPTSDSGGLNTAGFQTISWIHIESITNTGGGPAIITGTNGDDIITIIARDSSYARGHRWRAGFHRQRSTTAPTFCSSTRRICSSTPWPATIRFTSANRRPTTPCGTRKFGSPAARPRPNTGNVGDQIVLETPGTQNVTYAPDRRGARTGRRYLRRAFADRYCAVQRHHQHLEDHRRHLVLNRRLLSILPRRRRTVRLPRRRRLRQSDLPHSQPDDQHPNPIHPRRHARFRHDHRGRLCRRDNFCAAHFPRPGHLYQHNHISAVPIPTKAGASMRSLINGSCLQRYRSSSTAAAMQAQAPCKWAGISTVKTLVLNTPGIAHLDLNGMGGADYFYSSRAHCHTASTTVEGSDPIANLSGATGPVTVISETTRSRPSPPSPATAAP